MKYKLTNETENFNGRTLYRIEALKDFSNVHEGDKGGFIENERNLSQFDNCWVYDSAKIYDTAEVWGNASVRDNAEVCYNAKVFGNAEVCDYAIVHDKAIVHDNAKVWGNASVRGNAMVFGNASVHGNAIVFGHGKVYGHADVCGDAKIDSMMDYIVFKNWWSSGRYFTWTRSNNMWKVGCFYGSGKELIERAYNDSKKSGDEYKAIVEYVKSRL